MWPAMRMLAGGVLRAEPDRMEIRCLRCASGFLVLATAVEAIGVGAHNGPGEEDDCDATGWW